MLCAKRLLDKHLALLVLLNSFLELIQFFIIGAGCMQRHDLQVDLAVVLLVQGVDVVWGR